MTTSQIAHLRLHNQLIIASKHKNSGEVVKWLGAVQAQDYLGSLWAMGLRQPGSTEALVERAIIDKTIVRTWPMRGTLHFVAADDVHWMLKLLTPRVIARCATLYRQSGLDQKTFSKSKKLFIKALEDGKHLTRPEMYDVLERSKISTAGQRGLHIVAHLAQEGLLCFGPRIGKQQAFTLLEEWLPQSKVFHRDDALAELAKRYFVSHGPATLQDYTWWSGLSPVDARASLEMVKQMLAQEVINNSVYWMGQDIPTKKVNTSSVHLLPSYDEFTVSYKDRSAVLDPIHSEQAKHGIFNPVMILNGQVMGTWKRTLKKDNVLIEVSPFVTINKSKADAIKGEAERYGRFGKTMVELMITKS